MQYIIGFILGILITPGFLVASFIDLLTVLKTSQIWGIALISTSIFVYLFYRKNENNFLKSLFKYLKISFIVFIPTIALALITEFEICYVYTFKKAMPWSDKNSIEETELKRGRIAKYVNMTNELCFGDLGYDNVSGICLSAEKVEGFPICLRFETDESKKPVYFDGYASINKNTIEIKSDTLSGNLEIINNEVKGKINYRGNNNSIHWVSRRFSHYSCNSK